MDLLSGYRYPLLFIAIFASLQWVYHSLPEPFIQQWLIHYFTVVPGVNLLNSLFPEYEVIAKGTRLLSENVRLNVMKGCEGTEAIFMLVAAILACVRCPLKSAIGLLLGTLLIFIVNQIRVLALFLIAAHRQEWFEITHGYIAPLIIVSTVAIYFFQWLEVAQPKSTTSSIN
jgi:exosortase family protein XrtM